MQIMKQSLLRQLLNVWTILCKQWHLLCAYVANKVVNITPPLFASTGRSFTRFALLVVVLIGGVNVWGAETVTATWTATSSGLGSGTGEGTIKDSQENTWDYTRILKSGASYTGWNDTKKCIQLGKNGGVENLTLTTDISGTIKSVSIECSSYNSAHKVEITVGSTTFLASTATAKWETITTLTGTGSVSGQIKISVTGGSRAFYIKSITVTYEASAVTPPGNSHDVMWVVNGDDDYAMNEATHGYKPTLPTEPGSALCDGSKIFVGWTEDDDYSHATDAPNDLFRDASSAPDIDDDKIFVAVFATQDGEGGGISSQNVTFADGVFAGEGETATITWTESGVVTILQEKGTGNNVASYLPEIRWYQNNIITFTPLVTITKIEIGQGSSNNGLIHNSTTLTNATFTKSGNNVTIIPIDGTQPITIKLGAQSRPTSIKVHYSGESYTDYVTTCRECTPSNPIFTDVTEGKLTKTFGDAPFTNGLTVTGSGTKTFGSTNGDVATVDTEGKVTIVGAGSTTISVTIGETDTHCSGSAQYTLTVNKATPTASFDPAEPMTKSFSEGSYTNVCTRVGGDGAVTYESSDTKVATVDNTGKVTFVGAGNVTITANVAETANYNATSATYSLTINCVQLGIPVVIGTSTTNSVMLNWAAIDNANAYEVTFNGSSSTVTTNSFTKPSLTAGTAYNWSVKAKNTSTTGYCESEAASGSTTTIPTYTITTGVNLNGAGSVTLTPSGAQAAGTTVTATASVNEGYTFIGWTYSGAAEISGNPATITVEVQNTTLTANYEAITPTITFSVNGKETDDTGAYNRTLTPTEPTSANCDNSKVFVGWTTDAIASPKDEVPSPLYATSALPKATEDKTYYAVFATQTTTGSGSGNYEKVTTAPSDWSGEYLIVYDNLIFDGSLTTLDAVGNTKSVTISNGVIAAAENDDSKFIITSKSGGYSIKSARGYYIGKNDYNNGLESSESDIYVNTISVSEANVEIVSSGGVTLRYNSNTNPSQGGLRFRYYKTAGDYNKLPQLYKKNGGITITNSGYITQCSNIDESKYHNVTVVVSPVSAVGCSASAALASVYEDNKTTLTAKVATGYTFGGWEVERTDPDSEGTVATITDATALETTLIMGTTAVTVTAKFVEGEWEIVKNENFLQPGDKVVIADNAAAAVACAGAAGANNLGSQPARFSDDKLTITYLPEAAQIFTLATTEDKRWRFFNDNGTLGANSEDERQLNFNVQNPMTQWAISVTPGSPYTAKILALEGSNSRTIFHNSTSKYFTARGSKGEYNDPNLYYKKTNTPRIIVSTYSLDEFTYPDGRGPSTSKTFTVKGINIHDDASVTLTASADWQICETKDGTYSTSISLSYDEIENKEVTIFVRMGKGLDEGNVSGTLRAVSTDAQARTISLSGTVTPTHEVIWMSEGEQYGMEYVLDNEQAHIPSDPTPAGNCVGKVFVGWSATNIVDNEGKPISIDTRPSDLFTTAPTITADVTYYAVWADAGTVPGEDVEYKLVTLLSELKEGDAYLGSYINYSGYRYYYVNTSTISSNKIGMTSTTLSSTNILSPKTTDENISLVSTGVSNQYYIKNTSGQYLYSDATEKLSWSSTKCAWTFSSMDASTGVVKATSSLNTSVRLGAYGSSTTNGYIRTPKTTNTSDVNICVFMGSGGTTTYSSYSTSCPCDAPSTPLAIAGETFGTLPIDGSAFTKTFAIVEGSGNGNAVQWEVEPYTASLNRETGAFSTTTAGTYTITAMQSRNGDYCKQVASITFEVRIPDVDYTVTFVDGGKSLATKTVDWGSTVTPPTSPASCPESMFVGWTTSDDINNFTLFSFTTPIYGDITLCAVYDKGTCEDTYSRIESTPTEYDAAYVLASPNGQYGMIGVLANGQMTVVPIVNEANPPTLSTITEPVEDLVWQITKHEGTSYYRVFNRNMHKYLSIAADGSISLGSTPADVYIEFSDEYKELTIYNTSRTYALTWGSSFSRPLSTQDTYDEDTKTYYIATWGFYLYERDCEDAQYTFTSTCCANNPTNVVATATATTITISWDCPVDNADLRIYTNDASEIVDKAVEGKTGFTHTFTGLTKNTDYFIRIWGNGDCAGELTHVTTTDATVDIVDWGTYEGADNDNEYKTGVTLNLSDPDVEATVSVGSETIITEDNERAAATELFFSKYYEAAGDLKMIAIYNGTNTAIDLTDYVIYITEEREFLNLAGQDHTLVLTDYVASIPAGAEYIFYRTGDEMDLTTNDGETLKDCIKFTIQDKLGNAKGLGQETWFETEECVWSGKQSLALFKGDKMIDIIGSHTGSADQEDWSGVDADNSKQLVLKDNWPTIKETYFPVYEGPDFHGDNNGFVALGKSYEDQKDIILSTNRCLLIRKNTVTSGTNAVQSNYNGQGFATLGTEWEGKNISVGGSNTDATTITNVCSSFSAICSFDYTQYYVTYTPLTLENPTLGGMLNTDGTFTIPFDVDNLACKRIKIETKKGDEVLLSTQVRVPIIVDENTTTDGAIFTTHINEIHKAGESSEDLSAEEIAAICKTCDVVVKGGEVTLTHAENTIPQINNLTVQNGAKLKVNDGKHFTVASVTLRSDKDVVPHLILPTNTSELASNQKIVRFTKRIPGDRYYFFSLPFDCNVEDIMLSNGQKAIFNRDIYILYYDGAKRAKEGSSIGGDNWVDIDPTQPLVAGQGYALAVENRLPTEVIFPMTITNTALHELDNASKTINITAHGFDEDGNNISGKKPNNIGWNFVGNPYFTHYGTLADVDLKHGKIEVVDGVVGETWSDVTSLYVNVPEENTDENYIQKKASDINLSPFFPFFVQVGKTGTLEYTPGTRVLPAAIASRYAQEMEDSENSTPIYVGVSLSNGQKSDETSLVINNRFTQEYEVGADLEKLLGFADKPQVYVKDDNYRYAFKALNETDAANTNTVGLYLPAKEATTYTFDIMRNYDLSRVQGVYLTDHVAGTVTNLLQEKYVFTSGYSYTNNRFALSVVLAPKDVTSLTDIEAAWSVWQDAPLHISLQGLCVGDAIRVIDATGKLVSRLTATETSAMFDLPTAGSYCIQTIGVNGMKMKKIVVR